MASAADPVGGERHSLLAAARTRFILAMEMLATTADRGVPALTRLLDVPHIRCLVLAHSALGELDAVVALCEPARHF